VKETTMCPWCGSETALRVNGLLNKHGYQHNRYETTMYRPKPCEGSGRDPREIKPLLRLRTSTV
jgi:hypothetical protein